MKKIYTFKLFTLLLAGVFALAGCNKEDDESLFAGSDNAIAAFTLVKDGIPLHGAVSPNTIVITVPERLSLEGAVATVTLSENATIAPDPAAVTDWAAAQTFTVTAHSGAQHTYAYSVERHFVSRNGDVMLLSEADMAAFVEEVKDVDQLDGRLTIGYPAAVGYVADPPKVRDTIRSLEGLGHLRVITGGVIINSTYAGEDLTVFENLEKTGSLYVQAKKVRTVRFPKLAAVRLDLNIDQASLIRTLDFPELTTADKNLRIYYVDSLATLNFPKLQQVIESMTVQGRTSGTQNLQVLAFPALQTVGGSFTLSYWREVPEVSLPELTEVGGAFAMTNLTKAENIAMPKLETTGGLSISGCTVLASIDFDVLKTVNGNMSPNLTTFAEVHFPVLETVTGSVSLPSSATLTTLRFPKLETCGGLTIPNATNLTPAGLHFPVLKTVTGTLSVALTKLTDLSAFSTVETIGGQLSLNNLTALTSVNLPVLKSVDTYYLNSLTALTELDVRGIAVNTISMISTTSSNLTLIGDADFPGKLDFNAAAFPLTLQGIERVGEVAISTQAFVGTVEIFGLKHVIRQLNISGMRFSGINLPDLTAVDGTLTITGTSNTTFKDLSGFSALTSAGGVTITNFTQLKNFEPLQHLFPALPDDKWTVTGCGYNPTHKQMVEGAYSNE